MMVLSAHREQGRVVVEEVEVTYANRSSGWTPGKIAAVLILVIIAILAVISGILYFTEPARSLPSVLGTITQPASRAAAHRNLRGVISLVIGAIFLIAAWFAARSGRDTAR